MGGFFVSAKTKLTTRLDSIKDRLCLSQRRSGKKMMVKFGRLEIEFNNLSWYQDKAVIDAIAARLGASKSRSSNKICNSALKPFGTRLLIRVFRRVW